VYRNMLFTFALVQHLQVHIHAKGLPNLTQIWKSGMEGWFPGCEKPHCANMAGTTNVNFNGTTYKFSSISFLQ